MKIKCNNILLCQSYSIELMNVKPTMYIATQKFPICSINLDHTKCTVQLNSTQT